MWGKKKLELEQRQQLGGGGAQSIKVGHTIWSTVGGTIGGIIGVTIGDTIGTEDQGA